jgi:hypothetical protein
MSFIQTSRREKPRRSGVLRVSGRGTAAYNGPGADFSVDPWPCYGVKTGLGLPGVYYREFTMRHAVTALFLLGFSFQTWFATLYQEPSFDRARAAGVAKTKLHGGHLCLNGGVYPHCSPDNPVPPPH